MDLYIHWNHNPTPEIICKGDEDARREGQEKVNQLKACWNLPGVDNDNDFDDADTDNDVDDNGDDIDDGDVGDNDVDDNDVDDNDVDDNDVDDNAMTLKAEDSIQIPADTISGLYCWLYWKMTTIMMKLQNMMETESQGTPTSCFFVLLFGDLFWLKNKKN